MDHKIKNNLTILVLLNVVTISTIIFLNITNNQIHALLKRPLNDSKTITTRYSNNNNAIKLSHYFHIHRKISASNSTLKRVSINGLTPGGYGNKLYSFLSSLLVAILTESQIVLRWRHIDKYVDPPINIFDNVSENIPGLIEAEMKAKTFRVRCSQCWRREKNVDSLMKTEVPRSGYLRYLYDSYSPFFMELAANPDYFPTFSKYGLVTKETLKRALNATSTKKEKKESLLRVGFEIGGNLLNG